MTEFDVDRLNILYNTALKASKDLDEYVREIGLPSYVYNRTFDMVRLISEEVDASINFFKHDYYNNEE